MAVDKIDLNNLDKSDWKTYRFDEIAQNISERVDPNNTDLEVYVGLEHIDSESLHIKRFGTPDDVNGTKLKFYKGDIIFGRRRAYQRKAGIAPCDGFCSAHALVLRAKSEAIDSDLFPFFLHSNLFMNRAVDISVGSLSPTINWGTLKHQEFLIPPFNIQKQLANLFHKADKSVQEQITIVDKLDTAKHALFNELHKLRYEKFVNLEDLCIKVSSGGTPNRSKQGEYFGGSINWVKTKELNDWLVEDTEEKITELGLNNSSAKLYPEKTILLAMYGVTVGKIGIIQKEMACNQACCALVVDESLVDHWFLFYYLIALRSRLIALSVGSAQPNISSGIIKKLKIPDLDIDTQVSYSNKFRQLDITKISINDNVVRTKKLLSTLTNQVF